MATALGYSQASRALKIASPLGDDKLLLRAVSGQEAISQPFRFQLDLLSEDDSIQFDRIVGKSVTLQVEIVDGQRYLNGFISRFSQGAQDGRFTNYRAEMVPWLWFLTRTADCRIFQNKTVPDIVQQIFKDLGFADFSLKLYKSYRTRDYCVQYRETDFNFVSRLMEEEGIYYFFRHEQGKHTMILMDDASAQQPCPNQPKATCDSATGGGWSPGDTISELRLEEEFRPSAWAHTDYNFETPSTSLMVTVQQQPKWELYDYPGIYPKRGDGDKLAKLRLEETNAFKQRATGKSNCRAFNAGFTVEVNGHYRSSVNQKWLLTAVYHQATMGGSYTTGAGEDGAHYGNTFECIPASTPFRPPRSTPKPHVQGCQTAIVVGPGGEEIHTDKFGRVKVQFHWDREGKKNENSSCWVRVSHPWAGKGWGGIQIPRIGQEVVVDFLEGDPDQPLIIGRVYHAENMPPWSLPAKAVVSGFKSDSTKGGGGYNEFSMDDTKGNELIQMHAQFDQDIKVEHDERTNVVHDRTESVGHDETITIGHDRTEKVANNETITIGVNRTEKVGANEKITIGSNRNESVGSSEVVTVGLTRTHSVGVNDMLNVGAANEVSVGGLQAITVGAARAVTVGAAQAISVGASQTTNVGANNSTTVGGNQSFNVGGNESFTVGGNQTIAVSGNEQTDIGKKCSITAGDSIVLTAGKASISLNKDGSITINGKDISITGSGAIDAKASKNITMKGQKVLHN